MKYFIKYRIKVVKFEISLLYEISVGQIELILVHVIFTSPKFKLFKKNECILVRRFFLVRAGRLTNGVLQILSFADLSIITW